MENSSNKIILQVEVWQAQNYWPIKGWAAPLSGTPHFYCALLPGLGADNFPEDLSPPQGWEWADKWQIDSSTKFGQPDAEGWYFAATFDRLNDLMKSASATGVTNATSLVRKRRWVRNIQCVSTELIDMIRFRIDNILKMRRNIELSLKNKENAYKAVKFYEENRSFVFSQSLNLATQGILNTLSVLKDLGNKLKLLKQFLYDRAMVEKEYANRLENLGLKYSPTVLEMQKFMSDTSPMNSPMKAPQPGRVASSADYYGSPVPPKSSNEISSGTVILQCADVFFTNVAALTKSTAFSQREFASNLLQLMSDEVNNMLGELQIVLKDARAVFRKNSDICRLSEAAVRNFLMSVNMAFESVTHASLKDVSMLSEELSGLRGGVPYSPSYFTNIHNASKAAIPLNQRLHITPCLISPDLQSNGFNPSGSQSMPNSPMSPSHASFVKDINDYSREDMWLSIQRYKVAVRDSQEALCVLISESMDLELQQQILANRVHNLFSSIVTSYSNEQMNFITEIQLFWKKMLTNTLSDIQKIGLPNPVLQSPFAKLDPLLKDATLTASTSGQEDNRPVEENDQSNLEYENFVNSIGIFSFTSLYKEPLPTSPSVVKAGTLLLSRASDFRRSKNIMFDAIWKTSYAVATSDGYLHLISNRKSDIPDLSFFLPHCIINETKRDFHQYEFHRLIFEVSLSPILLQKKQRAMYSEAIFLRTDIEEDCVDWIELLQQLTSSSVYLDEEVERDAKEAMLQSLPILKGETAKIDLELQKYEVLNLESGESAGLIESNVDEIKIDDNQDNEDYDDTNPDFKSVEGENEGEEEELPSEEITETIENSIPEPQTSENTNNISDVEIKVKQYRKENKSRPKINLIQSTTTPVMKTPPPNPSVKNYGFVGSSYKKDSTSWIKAKEDSTTPIRSSSVVGVTPVAEIKPKQIIPKVDKGLPLAKRHSNMIAQYELGLKQEKEQSSLKVQQTRGQRLKNELKYELEDGEPSSPNNVESNEIPSEGNGLTPVTSTGNLDSLAEDVSTKGSKKKLVKKLSQKFDPQAFSYQGMSNVSAASSSNIMSNSNDRSLTSSPFLDTSTNQTNKIPDENFDEVPNIGNISIDSDDEQTN